MSDKNNVSSANNDVKVAGKTSSKISPRKCALFN